ncbi:MAG: Crp/Fnr family transcriptional regulator [Bacteroidales bacterium]|nr:Crp/Fnr family transcriptional regulator [Bacteroidales bacterium]
MINILSYNFSPEEINEFEKVMQFIERVNYKKNEFITGIGETEKYYYLTEEGIIRFWTIRNGKEVTLDFVFPTEFAGSYESLVLQEPSKINLQALTPVSLMRIAKAKFEEITSQSLILMNIKAAVLEKFLIHKFQREFQLLCDSPEERYIGLTRKYPELLNLIPLKYIASYLGVTPETVSRIRSRTSGK